MPSIESQKILRAMPKKATSFSYDFEEILQEHNSWESSVKLNRTYAKIKVNERCWYQLINESNLKTIVVYLHGGGFIVGSAITHQSICENIALHSNTCVANINYPLAPQYKYPSAIEDIVSIYKLLQNKYETIILAGDSAGGCLAMQTYFYIIEEELREPDGIVLISPWLDLELSKHKKSKWEKEDPLVCYDDLKRCAWLYTEDTNKKNVDISPCFKKNMIFPPMKIIVGSSEMLKEDAYQLIKNNPNSFIQITEYEGMWHVWIAWASTPEAVQAYKEIADFIIKVNSTTKCND